ncbi:MAG: 4Fe-4S dicluster domain-containing protein [Clostridia bacterium]|nr:4Fe-4S dicluster domain-containing protein [Clostridia bacterium]
MSRVDGRTVMFARMRYEEGSEEYEDYYKDYPEHKALDDHLRREPQINGEGTAMFDTVNSPFADAAFMFLEDIHKLVDGPPKAERIEGDAETFTRKLKSFSQYIGAKVVGVADMQPEHYYSIMGRPIEDYGRLVSGSHPFGLVVGVEMNKDMINRAPQMEELFAVTKGYVDAAVIALWMTYYIKRLGYDAKAHIDGNYEVIATQVAEAAGLGETGRNGLLISPEYGQRLRYAVVTTDMPLIADTPIDLGMKRFCELCNKCSQICPGKAISHLPPEEENGKKRWRIKHEECYKMWRRIGTDCGVCLSVCPFSQGVPPESVMAMKGDDALMIDILKAHEARCGHRVYIKEPLELMK